MSLSLDDALPEKRAARRAFDRARDFDAACFLHDEARERLLERLDFVRLEPHLALDVGCATARGAHALAARYPGRAGAGHRFEQRHAALGRGALRRATWPSLGGDAERLPLRSHCADLMLANFVLPWCRPDRLFAEAARVLAAGRGAAVRDVGPRLAAGGARRHSAAVDERIHVHAAFDMHDLGDLALAAGLAEPVLDVDRLEVTYADLAGLVRDLRAAGAINVAGGRRRSLTGPKRWQRFEAGWFRPRAAGLQSPWS